MSATAERHTKAPWRFEGRRFYAHDTLVGTIDGGYRNDRADARRIVACVNACEGIPTAELELAAAQPDARVRLCLLGNYADKAELAARIQMSGEAVKLVNDHVAEPHPAASSV